MGKARQHNQPTLNDSFDKFFTLYVVLNHLYAEATYRLARQGCVRLDNKTTFPDATAAQEYLVQYVGGAGAVIRRLNDSPTVAAALESLKSQVCNGTFAFKLHMVTGEPQPNEDADLCYRLTSSNLNAQACALLETLYVLRCNMFHGRKGFKTIQQQLLIPANIILERIVEILYLQLDAES